MTAAEEASALLAEYAIRRQCKVVASGQADVIDALHANGASAHLMARILREKFHFPIVYNTVQRHTRRECGCS